MVLTFKNQFRLQGEKKKKVIIFSLLKTWKLFMCLTRWHVRVLWCDIFF